MRKCIVFAPVGMCVNVIEDPENTYIPPENYIVPYDNTGEIFWYWDGDNWYNPASILINAYLGEYPQAETPETSDETDRLATTFYVRQKIQDYIDNVWLPNATISGGTFADAAIATTYNAGNLDGTNSNLTTDLTSPDFSDTGGNLSGDINGGSF